MSASCCSHCAVSSGEVRPAGASSNICLPLEVRWIYLSLFSIIKLPNNFSIMSARVATVPSPPVSPSVFFRDWSWLSMYDAGFSIAASSVASVNGRGGFVCPVRMFPSVKSISWPLTNSGRFSWTGLFAPVFKSLLSSYASSGAGSSDSTPDSF